MQPSKTSRWRIVKRDVSEGIEFAAQKMKCEVDVNLGGTSSVEVASFYSNPVNIV